MKSLMKRIKDKFKIGPIVKIYEFIVGGYKRQVYRIKKKVCKKPFIRAKERHSYGSENADKTFFVIFSPGEDMGLYSTVLHIIPYIEYAVSRRWIPIVDFKHSYIPMMQDEEERGLENSWEYYYQQPCREYTLEEVYKSKKVIQMLEHDPMGNTPKWYTMFPASDADRIHWSKLLTDYVRLNERMKQKLAQERDKIFQKDLKYLGVGIRAEYRAGMMRREALYNGHPKVPSCEEFIRITEDRLMEWNCDKIFLACDDREYLNKYVDYFGDKCVYMQRRLNHFFENDMPVLGMDMYQEYVDCSVREKTEEYIVETYLLAECDCLYSSKSGAGTFAYYINNGKYERVEVYDEGLIKL